MANELVDEAIEIAGEKSIAEKLERGKDKRRSQALMLLGGVKTADSISANFSRSINAQSLNVLELFQKEKLFIDLGYQTFDEFLDNSEFSPMSKTAYYRRKGLLKEEGEQFFDLYNDIGLSFRKRKLLGQGNVQLDGEKVIIVEGDEETEIEISDKDRLLQTLTAMADRAATLEAAGERKNDQIDRLTRKNEEQEKENERILAMKKSDMDDTYAVALLNVTSAFTAFENEIEKLSGAEREKFANTFFEFFAEWRARLKEAFGKAPVEYGEGYTGPEGDGADIVQNLNDEELEALME